MFDPEDCHGFCDNCKEAAAHPRELSDFTSYAQDALRLVQEVVAKGDKITQAQGVLVFVGSKTKDLKDKHHDMLQYFGKGSALQKTQAERVFESLLVEGAFGLESQQNASGWSNSYLKVCSHLQSNLAGSLNIVV